MKNRSFLKAALAALTLVTVVSSGMAMATHTFDDVPDGRFFTDPVEWAFDNGITTGTSATTFEPDRPVTRGENVTFAYRYDQNMVQPAIAELETTIASGDPVALGRLDVDGSGNVVVTGTTGLGATYDLVNGRFDVSLVDASLSPSTHVVHVTPIRINAASATEDRSATTFFTDGTVQVTVWDASALGPVVNDVHITIWEL